MPHSTLDLLPGAEAEAHAAFRRYAGVSIALAQQFLAELDRAFQDILADPARWPSHLHGTRAYTLHRFPYLVVYRHTAAFVRIIAVMHAHRRPGYWRRRVP